MSQTNGTATLTPAPKAPKAKKTAQVTAAPAKATKEKAVKKPVPAPKVKTPQTAPVEKDGLLKPQVRILTALAAAKKPLTKAQVGKQAVIPETWIAEYIGGTTNPKSDRVRGVLKLIPAGFVARKEEKVEQREDKTWITETVYVLTPVGRKALIAAQKPAKAK